MRLSATTCNFLLCSKLLALGVFASTAAADALHDHDNGPLTGIFGMPDSTEGAELLDARSSAFDVLLLTSSHSIEENNADEILILDGETTRFEVSYRYGFSSKLELGVELPFVWHQSGSLDSVIDQWHDIFGLPDGARDDRPQDLLEFLYRDASGDRVNIDQNSNGIGDIRFFGGLQLSDSAKHSTAFRFGIKLPTGSSEDLHGSGGTDLSLGVAGDVRSLWGNAKLSGFYRLHVAYLGEPRWLADRYEELVGQISGGLGYQATQNIGLNVQSTVRSPTYAAEVDGLDDPSMTITFGGSVRLSERWQLLLAVGEDIKVGSAPDVSFQLGLRFRPR